jgi:hypothetical protein
MTVRRWGGGAKVPRWLAQQYADLLGSAEETRKALQADGWDIRM